MKEVYLTQEEINIIRGGLKYMVKQYSRSLKRAKTEPLQVINVQKLAILAALDKKL